MRDVRTTAVVELSVRRTWRWILGLRLWALLLLLSWLLQAHLLHLALAHQLSVILLVVSCSAAGSHIGILLGWRLLLLRLGVLLLLLRLLLGNLL
jgi:hypothetical protein